MGKRIWSVWIFGVLFLAAGAITASGSPLSQKVTTEVPDTLSTRQANVPDSTAKKGFFRGIVNYFKGSNEDKTFTKKIDFSIIGGPHYSSDTKFGLGLVAAGLYRLDRTDSITPPSNVTLYGDITTTGFYLIGIRGNNFFREAKYRLDYRLFFFSFPVSFWGIGYEMGRNDDNESDYKRLQTTVKLDFMRALRPNWYVGVTGDFNFVQGRDFGRPEYLYGQRKNLNNSGFGLFTLYDSRDVVTDPHRGWYFKLEDLYYSEFLGNNTGFNSVELTLNHYHPVWNNGILAYDLHGKYLSKDVPWSMLARMGGSNRMRGYFEGRYTDKGLIEAQVELRQKIWRRIGATVWGGAGNIFTDFNDLKLSRTLPNYGVGLRWEFKSRVNVRLDYGFGKGQSAFIFNINEAF